MTFDFDRILQSKLELRQRLRNLPIVEKLVMLDTLRERALTLRGAVGPLSPNQPRAERE